MEDDALQDLLRRMAGLVASLNIHYDKVTEFIEEQRNTNRELHEFNKQQIAMNGRLETLVTRMLRQEGNGRDA